MSEALVGCLHPSTIHMLEPSCSGLEEEVFAAVLHETDALVEEDLQECKATRGQHQTPIICWRHNLPSLGSKTGRN